MADDEKKSGKGKGQFVSIEPAGEKSAIPGSKPIPPGKSGPPPAKSGD